MATCNNVIMLSIIFIISLAAMSPTLLIKADVVDDWCGRTAHNSFCVTLVNQDRRTNLKTGPNGIAAILRDRAVATAVQASLKIAPLLRDPNNDKRTADALTTCATDYFDIINEFSAIDLKTITRQTYPDLSQVIKTGINKANQCESSFRERPSIPSPVTTDNLAIREISTSTLEVIVVIVECNELPDC